MVLDRVFSDHCPIMLKNDIQDFGPTPFKFFNHWLELDGFNEFITNEWQKQTVTGCASVVLKEKFELLKTSIKGWIKIPTSQRMWQQQRS